METDMNTIPDFTDDEQQLVASLVLEFAEI
jgi:hypothetical protein